MDELSEADHERATALLNSQTEPYDLGFPSLGVDDARLCARYLLGCSARIAAQIVAANRGQGFDDVVVN